MTGSILQECSLPHDGDSLFGFDTVFLQKLERLALLNRRQIRSSRTGFRRSSRHGSSVEFADFRDYVEGDDMRRVDWNAYARLDRLFLRLYSAEQSTDITLYLDRSSSMMFGSPSKAAVIARLAAIFSYIALHSYDRVDVVAWGETLDRGVSSQSGTRAIPYVWRSIAALMAELQPSTDFSALRRAARVQRRSGLAIVLSDFLTDSDWQGGLQALRAAGQEVDVIQVLAPEELEPRLRGDWALRDAETNRVVEITVTPRLLRRYRDEFAAHTAALQDFCRRHDISFLRIRSDETIEQSVLRSLRSVGMLS